MAILAMTVLGALLCALRHRYTVQLARTLDPRLVALAGVGAVLELIGLRAGGVLGHALIVAGLVALLRAAAETWSWPGGKLLCIGLALNALVIAIYGRMPITPQAIGGAGRVGAPGAILEHSKNIVVEGWLASWLGDRFITYIPALDYYTIWSVGDFVILCGVTLMLTGRLNDER
jgi:hypothetical protein